MPCFHNGMRESVPHRTAPVKWDTNTSFVPGIVLGLVS
jgi:hypothetical protein